MASARQNATVAPSLYLGLVLLLTLIPSLSLAAEEHGGGGGEHGGSGGEGHQQSAAAATWVS